MYLVQRGGKWPFDKKKGHTLIIRKSHDGESDPEREREVTDSTDSDVIQVKRLQESGRQTRSFAALPEKLQRLCYVAQTWVADYTLFQQPLLSALDVINLVNDAWRWAQDQEESYLQRTKDCSIFVRL